MSWSAIVSLIGRVAQSVYVVKLEDDKYSEDGRLQIYVDDPLLAVRGTRKRRRLLAARFIAVMIILGIRLAFDKAQFGKNVGWIGVNLAVLRLAVEAAVPLDKLQAILQMIDSMENSNVITIRDLRSLAGKVSNIATVLYMWRPFLSQLWAALSTVQTNAPRNCVWTKQVSVSLAWLKSFITLQQGTVTRHFSYNAAFGIAQEL